MAIYYVSPSGSDSNNGLGPDASSSTNKPFLTLNKAIGASGVATAGDTVYLAPGVYRSGTSVGTSGTSGNPITIQGDPGNAQGFKDSSGNLLSPGGVRCTTYTNGDTTAAPGAAALSAINRSYLSFSNIWFVGGIPAAGGSGTIDLVSGAHDISFTACMFSHGLSMSNGYYLANLVNNSAQLALNITFDRCIFSSFIVNLLNITLTKTNNGTADYNANVVVQNCLFNGGLNTINIMSSGTGSFLGGGVTVKNCTALASYGPSVNVADSGISTTVPNIVQNSILFKNISANTLGQVVEDYNWLTGRSNVAAGPRSTSDGSQCLMLDFGQSTLWGQTTKPMGTPTNGSPQLGFGNASGAPSYDWLNRARPEGGKSLLAGIGYLERHDTAVQENSIVDSGSSIRIDGPGSHEFLIPVDATATSISVKCYFDANHGTATPPQAILVAVPEIGVASQTVTAPAIAGQWQTLTFSNITPTTRGVVRVLLTARPSQASGKAYFDTFVVS